MRVVLEQIIGIFFGGGAARAEVDDSLHIIQPAGPQLGEQAVGADQIIEAQAEKIFPLFIGAEDIGQQKIVVTATVEFRHAVAADEAGGAGDDHFLGHAKAF